MPWKHCDQSIADDRSCPTCGLTKEAWTVEWEQTRTFVISARSKTKDHLKLLLVDPDDDEIAGEDYEVMLPDQTVISGKLDEFGYAKIKVASPGTCRVRFPNLDDDLWEPADASASGGEASAGATVHRYRAWKHAVVVELHVDPQATGTYRLRSAGGYQKEQTSKDDRDPRAEYLELRYLVPSDQASYTFEIDSDDGSQPVVVFEDVPYAELALEPEDSSQAQATAGDLLEAEDDVEEDLEISDEDADLMDRGEVDPQTASVGEA